MREAIQSSLSIKATTQSSSFSGPLPPPEMLKEYDNVLPGAADRIIKMAETQSDHRQKLESKVVSGEVVKSYLGMACGFVVAIAGMSIGGFLLNEGHTIGGSIFAGVPLTGLVTVFVVGATQRRKERETKARILTGTEPIQQAIAK
jgi:uncharacterized membrane protein